MVLSRTSTQKPSHLRPTMAVQYLTWQPCRGKEAEGSVWVDCQTVSPSSSVPCTPLFPLPNVSEVFFFFHCAPKLSVFSHAQSESQSHRRRSKKKSAVSARPTQRLKKKKDNWRFRISARATSDSSSSSSSHLLLLICSRWVHLYVKVKKGLLFPFQKYFYFVVNSPHFSPSLSLFLRDSHRSYNQV